MLAMDAPNRPGEVDDLYVEPPFAVVLSLVLGLGFLVAAVNAVGGNDWVLLGSAVLAGVLLRQGVAQLAWRRRVRRHIEIAHPGAVLPTRRLS